MKIKNIIEEYRAPLERKYSHVLLPEQLKALEAMLNCRTPECGEMLLECPDCGHREMHPHSCGNRSCPQCQNHESTKWVERQKSKLLPVNYFLVTFTVPYELRWSAYRNQKLFFKALFRASSEALKELAANPRHLDGAIGMTAVLHTNNRRLDIHPHIHFIVPAGALNSKKKLWKKKNGKFLLPRKPLEKLFKGKLLAFLKEENIEFHTEVYSMEWGIDFQDAGSGEHAVEYLSRYLYRGVISEKSIIKNENGEVTFHYKNSKTKQMETRTLDGEDFLMLILQHVLPKGFRRTRDYGFLHGKSKKTLQLLQLILYVTIPAEHITERPAFKCPKCGHKMRIFVSPGKSGNINIGGRASPFEEAA